MHREGERERERETCNHDSEIVFRRAVDYLRSPSFTGREYGTCFNGSKMGKIELRGERSASTINVGRHNRS